MKILFSRLCVPLLFGRKICKMESTLSGLSFIDVKNPSDPASLLKEWIHEAKSYGAQTSFMNLATATKNGKVTNRTVVIRDITTDGSFVFTAQANSNKVRDIVENPQVATTVLLIYNKEGKNISRQIRITGITEKLSNEQCKIYYEKEKLHAKIRSWICQDCGSTDWNDLKAKHDELLKEVLENKKVLDMPDTQVAYKIVSNEIDFYYSCGDEIADRILYKMSENGKWNYERLKA